MYKLNDILEEFILELTIRNYTERTIKGYRNNNLRFFKYLKEKFEIDQLEDIKPLHIRDYMKYLKDLGRSAVYMNTILKNIRAFLKYCEEEEYIETNPSKKVKWNREEKTLIKTFNDKEVVKMINSWNYKSYYNARNKAIIATLIDTGIRNFELCNLKVTDVRKSVLRVMGKGNKERYVPISPFLKKGLLRYERIRENYIKDKNLVDDNYFLSYRCRALTGEAVERVVKITGNKANVRKEIRCSPHTFRHYYAHKQLQNGLDVYSLSRLLGHSNIQITKEYLRGLNDEVIMEMSIKTSPLMNLKV